MAGSDKNRIETSDGLAIILVEPQLGENIGTAARAMANFGLADLRLVNPRDGWPNERARAAASGADFVIDQVQVHATLDEAIADLSFTYATTARPRDLQKRVVTAEDAAANAAARRIAGQKVGILFGRERWGLVNDEISLADEIMTFPANPGFASFNLAQAVLLVGYEWFRAIGRSGIQEADFRRDKEPATRQELLGLFGHLEHELEAAGFFFPPEKRTSMVHNLRSLLHRAGLTGQEVRTLRGAIRTLVEPRPSGSRSKGDDA